MICCEFILWLHWRHSSNYMGGMVFSNGTSPVSFCFFSYFSNTDFKDKIVRFSEIQTLHVGVEGDRTDHLTTTTAKDLFFIFNRLLLGSMTLIYFIYIVVLIPSCEHIGRCANAWSLKRTKKRKYFDLRNNQSRSFDLFASQRFYFNLFISPFYDLNGRGIFIAGRSIHLHKYRRCTFGPNDERAQI